MKRKYARLLKVENVAIYLDFCMFIAVPEVENFPSELLVDIPIIPNKGSWFNVDYFLEKVLTKEEFEAYQHSENIYDKGIWYVREVHHNFVNDTQEVWLKLALTENDDGYYHKKYGP